MCPAASTNTTRATNIQRTRASQFILLAISRLAIVRGACLTIEVILEDDRGRGSVEQQLPFAPVLFATRQQALRLAAAQPLVLEDDR